MHRSSAYVRVACKTEAQPGIKRGVPFGEYPSYLSSLTIMQVHFPTLTPGGGHMCRACQAQARERSAFCWKSGKSVTNNCRSILTVK